jgi:hypothetical protein
MLKVVARVTAGVGAQVFVPQKSSIDIARDVVNRLEQEKKTAQEKLAKAHQQLVQTLVEELSAGVVSLEKSKKLVSGFNDTGKHALRLPTPCGRGRSRDRAARLLRAVLLT